MNKQNHALTLRPLSDADIPLMARWLHQDYILKWYHDPEDWLLEINGRKGEFAWIHHFIVMDGQTPVGFCQYYDCFDAKDMEDWYQVARRGETFSIDYLIGERDWLGKGHGKAIVRLLTDTIRALAGARYIVVQPDKQNQASNHVLLANGYHFDEQKGYFVKQLN